MSDPLRVEPMRAKQASFGLAVLVFIWAAAGAGFAYLATFFTSESAYQIPLSLGLVGVLLVLRWMGRGTFMRVLFLATGTFIVLRYFFWRSYTTLEFVDWVSFSCAIILFLAELYGMAVFLVGNFINLRPITRQIPPLPPAENLPTVDVFIPSYNETVDILETTLIAALDMRYPKDKLRVFLCDDGGTDQKCETGSSKAQAEARERRTVLSALCEKLGAVYRTRAKNVHAKAGNVNEAFGKSDGELIVIFDADHVPTTDFLEKTVGYFAEDDNLFLVQTPHFFTNPDPIERNLGTFDKMPSENEMFYRAIQKGLDFWNASFFCGSGAVLRRRCLEETGGISGDTITEDAETALELHSRGYNSAYMSVPVLSGLSPETMGGFIRQRIRWAQGMAQIFLLKCPLFKKGLTLPQRLCYFNSCFFWFFPFARLVYLLSPVAFLVFGLKIYAANFDGFLAYALPYLVAVLTVSSYLYGKYRWAFMSELYELIQSVYTLPAILSTVLRPRAPTFNVTPKGEHLESDFISPLVRPFYVLVLLDFVLVGFGVWRILTQPETFYASAITLAWATLNMVLLLATLGALLERRQRRATPRLPADIPAELILPESDKTIPCQIVDLSLGGAKLHIKGAWERSLQRQPVATLRVERRDGGGADSFRIELRSLRVDTDRHEILAGAQFLRETLEEKRCIVRLVTGDSQRWVDFQASRESRVGVVGSFLRVAILGFRYSTSHVIHLLRDLFNNLTGRRGKFQSRPLEFS